MIMVKSEDQEAAKQSAADKRAEAKEAREQDRAQDKEQRAEDKEARQAQDKVDDDAVGAAEEGNAEVQSKVDDETEAGYRGTVPDPTPNENYTVEGVTAGKPTPETDADLAAEARASVRGNDIPIKKEGDQ